MEVSNERISRLKSVTGVDKYFCGAAFRDNMTVFIRRAFQCSKTRRPNRDDFFSSLFGVVYFLGLLTFNLIPFLMHYMIRYNFFLYGSKSAKPYMQGNKCGFNIHASKLIQEFISKMQTRC